MCNDSLQFKCNSTTNMHRFKYALIALLCEFLDIRGERWYFADRRELGDKTIFIDQSFHNGQPFTPARRIWTYTNDKLQPSSVPEYTNNVIADQHFLKVKHQQKAPGSVETATLLSIADDNYQTERNSSSNAIRVNYNNTINFINLIKRKKRKKKIRRCYNQRIRNNKKVAANQTARTKFLEVFEVVEFENVACVSSSGLGGVCLHEYECESNGGSTMGTCADGYGTCCVTLFACDGQSSEPSGWFTNPGFPSPSTDRISCTFTLNKSSDDITQIRLDFVIFELLPPNAGTCQQDQFVVSGQNINSFIPILCGINTGQHVYVEIGDTEGPIYLSVQTISTENRLYSIKLTQLTSVDDLTAPTGCLQYFTEEQGIVESFNYRDKSEIGIARVPSYLNNLNYAVCIRRVPQTCSVTYTNADYMQIVNYDLDGLPVIPYGQAGVEIYNCPGDWLLISATRLCGDRLNDGAVLQDFSLDAPITDSNAGPIAVWFRSDEGYTGRGFKLQYQQNACNGPS